MSLLDEHPFHTKMSPRGTEDELETGRTDTTWEGERGAGNWRETPNHKFIPMLGLISIMI